MRLFKAMVMACLMVGPAIHAQIMPRPFEGWRAQDSLLVDIAITDKRAVRWASIAAADTLHVLAIGNIPGTDHHFIRRTTNGGTTWETPLADTASNAAWQDIAHPTPSLAVAVGASGRILRTTDGGTTWSRPDYPEHVIWNGSLHTVNFLSISMCDSLHGVISGQLNVYLHTSDGGARWQRMMLDPVTGEPDTTAPRISRMVCLTPTASVGATGDFDTGEYRIARSQDGGATWTLSALVSPVFAIAFADSLHGFAVGDRKKQQADDWHGSIQRTSDGGVTWELAFNDPLDPYYGLITIAAADATNALAVDGTGRVLRTTDGGDHWATIPRYDSANPVIMGAIAFPSPTTAWGIASGAILKYDAALAAVEDESGEEEGIALALHPAPLHDAGMLRYTLGRRGHVRLSLIDQTGREVAPIAEGMEEAGEHLLPFDRRGIPPGMYFLRIRQGSLQSVIPVVVK